MIKYLKNILMSNFDKDDSIKITLEKKIQIATCSLFIEIANADDEFSGIELRTIIDLMIKTFSLEENEVKELIELSQKQINKSVSFYEFTEIINKNFNNDEKFEIIKNLWRVILIDEILDAHEEYFLRIITKNLNMDHKDLITAKIMVKEEMGL
ncbi:MAG: TerB family tellurite resistance protein [Melioribacteraceae bacterium]|nr:TerB family tellurite resistance protein [Melioribacteraceae bacterium]